MKLHAIDLVIIAAYLLTMVCIGWIMRKKARLNKESYLLGGKSLPWYMLGLSDASDMFDISGTMWMVSLCFIYGMKSIWIPWLWPVFNQVFLMMYLSRWLRRSSSRSGHCSKGGRFRRVKSSTCPDGPKLEVLPDISLVSIVPSFRDQRLKEIQGVRQRSIGNHFILKVILRNGPNPADPTLF